MKKRNIMMFILALIFGLIIFIKYTNSHKGAGLEYITEQPKLISIDFAGNRVDVTEKLDINNILTLINQMKDIENIIVEPQVCVEGKFIYNDRQVPFIITENSVIMNEITYKDELRCQAIWKIIMKYDGDLNQFNKHVLNSDVITLHAIDMNKEIVIDNDAKEELIKVILDSELKRYSNFGAVDSIYPNYLIIFLNSQSNEKYGLSIINEHHSIIKANGLINLSTNNSLLDWANQYLPPDKTSADSHILSLFEVKEVFVNREGFRLDISHKKNSIVRLMSNTDENNKMELGEEKLEIDFYNDNILEKVIVFENGIKFKDVIYYEKDIGSMIESVISAG